MQDAGEIKRLQRCINDLVSILALPAMWTGREPSQIIDTLLDSLLRTLRLDVVYVRVNSQTDEPPVEVVRFAQPRVARFIEQQICDSIHPWLTAEPERWPQSIPCPQGTGNIHVVPFWLDLQGEVGVLVAGSKGDDFPCETERLILRVAANQAAIGLQEARLLSEQKRIARELDQRIEQRTRELADRNEELRREIVERHLAQEAFANARAELAKITRITSLSVLTASIAHEINQPLSGIITNANTCLRMLSANPPNVEGASETARRAIRDGNRASDVIKRLRALYSKKDISPESMDLNDATQEVISLVLPELQRNGVILRVQLAEDLPSIEGDRIHLQQVILNLLRNASDAMRMVDDRPRQLVIMTERDLQNHVRLSVQDAGIGFAPEDEGKLFDPFFTTKQDGMGIGLSVSRSIIEAHQGRLWAALNEGPGSTFSFTIPVRVPNADG